MQQSVLECWPLHVIKTGHKCMSKVKVFQALGRFKIFCHKYLVSSESVRSESLWTVTENGPGQPISSIRYMLGLVQNLRLYPYKRRKEYLSPTTRSSTLRPNWCFLAQRTRSFTLSDPTDALDKINMSWDLLSVHSPTLSFSMRGWGLSQTMRVKC